MSLILTTIILYLKVRHLVWYWAVSFVPHVAMSSTAGPEDSLIIRLIKELHIQSTWIGSASDRWSVKCKFKVYLVKGQYSVMCRYDHLCLAHRACRKRTDSNLYDLVTAEMKSSGQMHHEEKDSTCPRQGFYLDINRKMGQINWVWATPTTSIMVHNISIHSH